MTTPDKAREKLSAMVGEAVMSGVSLTMQRADPREAGPQSIHLGCNVALTALIPIVPFLAKRPVLATKEEIDERGPKELVKLLTYERILFAALISSRMHIDSQLVSVEKNGCNVSQEVHFGSHVMAQALEDWKKLTGKEPTDYFDNKMLRSIEEGERQSLAPFEDFLRGKPVAPSSNTLN